MTSHDTVDTQELRRKRSQCQVERYISTFSMSITRKIIQAAAFHQQKGDDETTPRSTHPDRRWFKEYLSSFLLLVLSLFAYDLSASHFAVSAR